MINESLRQNIQQWREPLEETLRRVLREELNRLIECVGFFVMSDRVLENKWRDLECLNNSML